MNLKHQHSSQRVHNNSGHLELLDICTVLGIPALSKTDEFSEEKNSEGGGSFRIQKILLQIFSFEKMSESGGEGIICNPTTKIVTNLRELAHI